MMASATLFDSLELARGGHELRGMVSVAQLVRLAEYLFDTEGALQYSIAGGFDGQSRPRLRLGIEGKVNLKCQRCLGKLPYAIAVETDLLLLTGSLAGSEALEDLDGVPASAHTDAHALVEDEVLLNVPFAARHAVGQCSTAVDTTHDRPESPFAALARLKQE